MKILHVNDTAGVASGLAKAQKALGNEVVVLAPTHPLSSDANIKVPSGRPAVLYGRAMAEIRKGYDVVHWHGAFGRLMHTSHRKVATIARSFGSRFVLHCHGDDVRGRPISTEDLVLVSTLDLVEFIDGPVMWLPSPVELPGSSWMNARERYEDMQRSGMKVAYYPHQDSEAEWMRKLGYYDLSGIRVEIVRGMDRAQALRVLDSSHAFLASPDLARYGMIEVEAALMQLPVVLPHLDRRYGHNCPLNLARSVDELLAYTSYVKIACRQQSYAAKVHNPQRSAEIALRVYEQLI